MSVEDPRLSNISEENLTENFSSDIQEEIASSSTPSPIEHEIQVAQAGDGRTPTTGRVPTDPNAPVAPAAPAAEVTPDANNIVHLAANVAIDDVHVDGANLILVQADGTEIVILNGATKIPTMLIGEVEVPQQVLFAALEDSGINVAAGPDGSYSASGRPDSSGAQFEDSIQGNQNGPIQLASLLGDTDFGGGGGLDAQTGADDQPIAINMSTPFALTESVLADGIPGNETITGVLQFDGGDDFGIVTSVNFNNANDLNEGPTPTPGASEALFSGGHPVTVTTSPDGLTVTGTITVGDVTTAVFTFHVTNAVTGEFTFTQSQPLDHPDGNEVSTDDILRLNFSFTVTDKDGDASTGSFMIDIADDGPSISGPVKLASVNEDDLSNGNDEGESHESLVSSAALGISWGADANVKGESEGDTFGRSIAFNSDGLPQNLTSGGVGIVYGEATVSANGTVTITAYKGVEGPAVFTVTLDPTSEHGTATFELKGPLDHASDSDALPLTFNYTATDADGDSQTGSFSVTVDDDIPTIGENSLVQLDDDALTGGNPAGNGDDADSVNATGVLAHAYGADGAGSVLWIGSGLTLPEGFTATPSEDGKVMTIYQGERAVVSITITDTVTGAYEVTQLAPINHPQGTIPGTEDNVQFTISYQVTDKDGDAAATPGTLTINVDDDIPTIGENSLVQLDDDALTGGNPAGNGDDADSVNATGVLAHAYGADGAGSVLWIGSGLTLPEGFTATPSEDGKVMTIYQGERAVVSITITDTVTGAYEVTQLAPINHPQGTIPGTEDNVQFTISYQVTDKDGDAAATPGTLTINVDDDTPVSKGVVTASRVLDDEAQSEFTPANNGGFNDENPNYSTVSGGAGALFTAGADGVKSVAISGPAFDVIYKDAQGFAKTEAVSWSGGVVGSDGTTTFTATSANYPAGTPAAVLVIKADGSYTFTLGAPVAHDTVSISEDNKSLSFDFTVTDGDGDKATGTLKVDVNDDTPAPIVSLVSGSATLDDEAQSEFTPANNGGWGDVTPNYSTVSGGAGALFTAGADGVKSVEILGAAFEVIYKDAQGFAKTEAVSWSGGVVGSDGTTTFTATSANYPAGTPAAVLVIKADGSYTFTLGAPVAHDFSLPGFEDDKKLPFGYVVTDGDGDHAVGALTIDVNDDTPKAYVVTSTTVLDDEAQGAGNAGGLGDVVNEHVATGLAGSLFTAGADGVKSVAINGPAFSVIYEQGGLAKTESVDWSNGVKGANGSTTFTATGHLSGQTAAVLVVNADGSYSFTAEAPIVHPTAGTTEENTTLSIGVTVTDGDGDKATGTLKINVNDDTPISTGVIGTGAITESAAGGSIAGELSALVSPGADGLGRYSVETTGLSSSLTSLTSGGVALTYSVVGNALVAKAGAATIFTFSVDPATGHYTFAQTGPLDHTDSVVIDGVSIPAAALDAAGSHAAVADVGGNDLAFVGHLPDGDAIIRVSNSGNTAVTWTLDNNNPGGTDYVINIPAHTTWYLNVGNVPNQTKFDLDGVGSPNGSTTVNNGHSITFTDGDGSLALDLSSAVTVTDGDGDSVALHDQLIVTVTDSVPTAGPNAIGTVEEGGSETITAALTGLSWGADAGSARTLSFTGSVATKDQNGASVTTLSSNGNPVTIAVIGGVLTGFTGSANPPALDHIVFTALLNAATGGYTFSLLQPLDHTAPNATSQYLDLALGFTATDADGDAATSTVTVRVDAAGSIDSINYSSLSTNVFVNLDGAAHMVGGQTVAADTATDGATVIDKVIGIDSVSGIVDALGGAGNDVLIGGDEANKLTGNGGNDYLDGGLGADVLDGGEGNDTFVLGADVTGSGTRNIQLGDGSLLAVNIAGLAGTADQVIGGAGYDTIILERDGKSGFVADYSTAPGYLSGVEKIVGTDGNDVILLAAGSTADGGPITIEGGDGNDILGGSNSADIINGGTGNDLISGLGGNDILKGGAGNDEIWGGLGADKLYGEDGNDMLVGGKGDDLLDGGTNSAVGFNRPSNPASGDAATIIASAFGGDTADYSSLTTGVFANLGDAATWPAAIPAHSAIDSNGANDAVGTDTLVDIENLTGGIGDDILAGDGNDNILKGGAGSDTLLGGAGSDLLIGGDDNVGDNLYAGSGNDVLVLGNGGGTAKGEGGNDLIYGGSSGDWLYGEDDGNPNPVDAGDDIIFAGGGNDHIEGGGGADKLYGEDGDDTLIGGKGDDLISGGTGNDTFVYKVGDGADVIDGGTETGSIFPDYDVLKIAGDAEGRTFTIGKSTLADPQNVAPADDRPDVLVTYSGTGGTTVRADEIEGIEITLHAGGGTINVGDLSGTAIAPSTIVITGGTGDDVINLAGLAGTKVVVTDADDTTGGDVDTMILAGKWADYDIVRASDGTFSFSLGGTVVATAKNIEQFTFAGENNGNGGTVQAIELVNDAPHAIADTNAGDPVIEAGGIANGTAGDASATGNVLTNDTDADIFDTRTVTSVQFAGGGLTAVPGNNGDVTVAGTYGTLTIHADGSYAYALDNNDADTQALVQNAHVSEVFTYGMKDAHGLTSTASLTIAITGTNDATVVDLNGAAAGNGTATNATEQTPQQFAWQASLADVDSSTLQSMTVTLAHNLDGASETLFLNATATAAAVGLNVGYNSTTGVLSVTGLASIATYETILKNIVYQDNSDNPDTSIDRTLTVVVNDGVSDSAPQVATVHMIAINDAPVLAGTLTGVVAEGGSHVLTFAELGYTDPDDVDGGVVFQVSVSGETHGVISNGGASATSFTAAELKAGLITYTHDGSEGPTASFSVKVEDGNEDNSAPGTGTFNFTVTPVNDAPVAHDDVYFIDEDTTLSGVNVLTNDTDAEGDTLIRVGNITVGGNPAASASLETGGALTYHAEANESGYSVIGYTVSDGNLTSQGTITVNIRPIADAATISGSGSGSEDGAAAIGLNIALGDTDHSEKVTRVELSGFPDGATFNQGSLQGGVWVIENAAGVVTTGLTMTPPANYNGNFTLNVAATVLDSAMLSDGLHTDTAVSTGSIEVAITAVNDVPVLVQPIADQSIAEEGTISFQVPAGTFSDIDSALTYTATLGDGSALPAWLHFDAGTGTFSGVAPLNYNGSFDVKVTATDGLNDVSDTFNIAVTPVNDTPTPHNDVFFVDEDHTLSGVNTLANDTDVDGDTLHPTAATITSGPTGSGLLYSNGDLVYTPHANASGITTIQYTVSDGSGAANATASATITVNIRPVADTATISGSGLGAEDAAANIALNIALGDTDGSEKVTRVELSGFPAGATFSQGALEGAVWVITDTAGVNTSGLTMTPPHDFAGNFDLNVAATVLDSATLTDGLHTDTLVSTGSIGVAITAVDDAPVLANAIADQSIPEEGTISFQVPGDTFSDVDSTLTYTATLGDGSALPAWLHFDPSTGTFSGDAPLNYNGSFDVKVTATDGLNSVSDTFNIAVTPVNDAAVLTPVTVNLTETNAVLTSGGTLTISDVDSPETFVAQTNAAGSNGYGKFTINTNGTWTYATNTAHDEFVAGQTYTDSITVSSADGTTTTITVNIAGTNDAAVLTPVTVNLTETNAVLTTGGTLTISDVDSPETFVAQTNAAGSNGYGKFTINTNGTWTYATNTAHDEFVAGQTYTDSITVSSADGATTTITVNIAGTSDAPTYSVIADIAGNGQGNAMTIQASELTGNTSSSATITAISNVSSLDLDGGDISADGKSIQIKDIGITSGGSFTYQLSDGSTGTVSVVGGSTITTPDNGNYILVARDGVVNTMTGSNGDNIFIGGTGADTIATGNGVNTVYGGGGNDTITTGNGTNTITGGSGNDRFTLGTGTNTITDLGNGDILVAAGTTVATADTNWSASSSSGSLSSNSGSATIIAAGHDISVANATGANGWTLTNDGDSTAVSLTGSSKADTITGGSGNDTLSGGAGKDTITGGGGNDTITGGGGGDTLTGGAGSDTFVIAAGDSTPQIGGTLNDGTITGYDVITDWGTGGTADKLDFSVPVKQANLFVTNGVDSTLAIGGDTVELHTVNYQTGIATFYGTDNLQTYQNYPPLSINSTQALAAVVQYLMATNIGEAGATLAFNAMGNGYVYQQTGSGAGGTLVELTGAPLTDIYTTPFNPNGVVSSIDPIILDLDHNGFTFTSVENGVKFDIDADGHKDQVAWTKTDGILAFDVDGNGKIDNGSEIFTPNFGGGTHAGGVAALSTLDVNHDGKIDASDTGFDKLLVWQDANGNGISDAGELKGLHDYGITGISLDAHGAEGYIDGQSLFAEGSFTYADGSTGSFVEVGFDTLFSDAPDHSLVGTDGDDILAGMPGLTQMTGGAGADTFVLDPSALHELDMADIITDYKSSEGDAVDVSKLLDTLLGHQATGEEAAANVRTTIAGNDTTVSVQVATDSWKDVAVLQNHTEAVKILFDDDKHAANISHV